jgi:hypothetical protein
MLKFLYKRADTTPFLFWKTHVDLYSPWLCFESSVARATVWVGGRLDWTGLTEDPMAKLDGELHVIVSRSTTVSAENGNIATLPSTSARVTAAKESKVAVSRRPTERREPLAQVAGE